MAAPIVIESRLSPTDISAATKQLTQGVKSALNEITNDAKKAAKEISGALNNAFKDIKTPGGGSGSSGGGVFLGALFGSFSGTAIISLLQSVGSAAVGVLQSIGSAAFQSAAQLDKSRQTLIALTGSVDAANKKLAELRELANSSPGVTVSLATQAFAQLKAVGTIADDTINKLIKSVGKLNAVFSIEDSQGFIRNLTQIFSQGFEKADIKEALGRVPIFNQILQEAFKTSDPAALRTLKESGKLTLDSFLKAISDAIETDPRFKNIQESIGSQFEKAKDRVLVALAPIGDQIAAVLLPKLKELAVFLEPFAEKVGQQIKDARGEINALIADVIQLGAEFARTFKQAGLFTSLKSSLEDIRKIVQVITVSVATLKDLIELGASAVQFAGTGSITSLDTGKAAYRHLQGGFANRRRVLQEQADRNFFAGAEVVNFGNTFDPKTRQQIVGLLDPKTGLPVGTAAGAGFKPPPGGAGGSSGSAGQALAQARAIRQAQLQFERESLEQEIKLNQDASERQLDIAKDRYDKGLLATRAYYDLKLGITQETLGNEINLLNQEALAVQENLSKAKAGSVEQIRLKAELLKINTEIALKTRAVGDAERINLEEFKKALGELEKFDASKIPSVTLRGTTIDTGPLAGLSTATSSEAQRQGRENLKAAAEAARDAQVPLIELRTKQVQIQDQVNQGVLTEAEGRQQILALQRQSAAIQISILEAQKKTVAGDAVAVAIIDEQIAGLRSLGVELNNAQRFMKGFGRETETVGDIFERFGQNVANAFRSTKGLLDGLKNAVKSFFADLLGNALQSAARSALGAIFGGGARAGGGGSGGFGTPPFNPAAGGGGGSVFGGVFQNLGSIFSGGGGGIGVPVSASTPPFNPGFTSGPPGVSGGGLGGILGNLGNLGNLFKGIGFGLPGGSTRGGLAGALPLLGIGLGSSLGGSSLFGNLLGGIGGGLLGIGLTAAPAGLGALGFLAPLFSNPITAAIGAALLPVAFLFGKAKQRRADEKSSGDALTDAIHSIEQLGRDVASDQVDGADARQIFEDQILATFIAQINQLKTKSVRESRLTNQVRDLRNLFEIDVTPQIVAQQARIARLEKANEVSSKLLPEFAVGGVVPGLDRGFDSVMAMLRPNEMVLTLGQQAMVKAIGGGDIFSIAGVPGAAPDAGGAQAFAGGGRARFASGADASDFGVVIENLTVGFGMSQSGAEEIFVRGGSGSRGRSVTVNNVRSARTNREL